MLSEVIKLNTTTKDGGGGGETGQPPNPPWVPLAEISIISLHWYYEETHWGSNHTWLFIWLYFVDHSRQIRKRGLVTTERDVEALALLARIAGPGTSAFGTVLVLSLAPSREMIN